MSKPLVTEKDMAQCMGLRDYLALKLDQPCHFSSDKEIRKHRFIKLTEILQNMNAGKRGGGLSGGLACEKIWVELLKDINANSKIQRFSFETREADADYGYCGTPFSHKTLGFRNKNADLALAWSKNRPGGIVRRFESSIVLVSFRPMNPRSRTAFWRTAETGVYIIPLTAVLSIVRKFKPNNKTSTLIKAEYVAKLMDLSVKFGLFIKLEVNPIKWSDYELSHWKAGDACIVRRGS
jgi:hypothetical protein